MPIIFRRDKVNYIPKETIRMHRYYGGAIFLPNGRGIESLFNFFNANKDSIKSIADTVSNVTSAATSVGKFATDTAKGIEEIKALRQRNLQLAQQPHQAITDNALKNIIENEEGVRPAIVKNRVSKKGGSFYKS